MFINQYLFFLLLIMDKGRDKILLENQYQKKLGGLSGKFHSARVVKKVHSAIYLHLAWLFHISWLTVASLSLKMEDRQEKSATQRLIMRTENTKHNGNYTIPLSIRKYIGCLEKKVVGILDGPYKTGFSGTWWYCLVPSALSVLLWEGSLGKSSKHGKVCHVKVECNGVYIKTSLASLIP